MNKISFNVGDALGSPWGTGAGRGIGDLVSVILSNAVAIAGIIMLLLMVGGGIAMISGAGRGDPE